jgi:hypothetical protein
MGDDFDSDPDFDLDEDAKEPRKTFTLRQRASTQALGRGQCRADQGFPSAAASAAASLT